MAVVKLFCAIVGVRGSPFSVKIDASESVDDLKDAITVKQKYDFAASKLQLFLAKKDGAWMGGAGMETVTLDEHGHPQGFVQMDPLLFIKNAKHFGTNFTPEEGQIHVLVVVPEGAGSFENKRKRKRTEYENAPDGWIKALKDITMSIVNSVIDPVGSGFEFATEDTYHLLWDSLIVGLLRRVSEGRFRRNTNASASTGLYRPDMCFYYKNSNTCVFRGEEKASGEMQVPVKELHDKLTWRYDAAPYIFGYAAVGLSVCLVAIQKVGKTKHAKAEVIKTFDLGDLRGRLSFFLALLNLSTLFRQVVDLIQPLGVPEYGIIERSNGVQITFAEDCVVKTYPPSLPSNDIIRNLRELHRQMVAHSVPNVVKLTKSNMKEKRVVLAPIGRLSPPENVHQLLAALRDILKALVALHAINLMHRDLRWDNVLKSTGEGDKWFLIDFDEGASSPAPKSISRDHAMLQEFALYLELGLKCLNMSMLPRIFADFLNEQENTLAPMMQTGFAIVTIYPVLRTSPKRLENAKILLQKPKSHPYNRSPLGVRGHLPPVVLLRTM
ncbi:Serine/threonine protein kinase [Phytophthora megakarya]|uniref:Serine/threonine protein kinase n=1 Tax=Phytophthora megakarya TaxID=4795 RepID=A0A225VT01_9STRA|nr:Serine/threonine protein kinase [Phytophthora megakarya]